MLLYIHGKNIPITAPLRTQVERRVHFALDRIADRIDAVRVRFEDINGPKGGADKRCVIVATGSKGWVVRSDQIALDSLAALNAAIDRVERMVYRLHERRRTHASRPCSPRGRRTA
jgi:putative sigma-54 modulation protein